MARGRFGVRRCRRGGETAKKIFTEERGRAHGKGEVFHGKMGEKNGEKKTILTQIVPLD